MNKNVLKLAILGLALVQAPLQAWQHWYVAGQTALAHLMKYDYTHNGVQKDIKDVAKYTAPVKYREEFAVFPHVITLLGATRDYRRNKNPISSPFKKIYESGSEKDYGIRFNTVAGQIGGLLSLAVAANSVRMYIATKYDEK